MFPRFALMEAVGVPDPMLLMKANFADAVLVPPRSRSAVLEKGEIAPLFNWK